MATKLKKLTDKSKNRLLFFGWVLLAMLLTLTQIYSYIGGGYYYYYRVGAFTTAAVILGAVSFVWMVFLSVKTYKLWKKMGKPAQLNITKIDMIKIEPAAVITAAASVILLMLTAWNIGFMESPIRFIRFLFPLFLVWVVLAGGILVLIRRCLLGTVKETSLICREIQYYRERTSMEKRLCDKRKVSLILYIIITIAIVAMAAGLFMSPDDIWAILTGVMAILGLLLFFKTWISNREEREAGYLIRQIHAMASGEAISEEIRIPEDSVFHKAACELENIGAAMEKSAQKQIQAERLKIDLITNVSHDLKTPLTSMVGYIDLLKKEELSDTARDYVEVLSSKEEQLKAMIQDLFELSKATSQTEQLHMENLDMQKLVEQILGDMEDSIAESGRSIRTSFGGHPLIFSGDNGKMYRVVQNLLENALKYSLEGTRIYVDVTGEEGYIVTVVKNIASYEMDFATEEITERFARGDKSRSTEGHGLGLAIASSLTANMGGTLGVEVDGDMFKAIIRFPRAKKSEENDSR